MQDVLPAGGLAIALLWQFIEYLIVSGLIIIWAATIGWFMIRLGDWLNLSRYGALGIHLPDLGKPIRVAEHGIREFLLDEQRGLEIMIGATWHALKEIVLAHVHMLEWLVKEIDAANEYLDHKLLPRWGKWAAAAALPAALVAKIVAAVVAKLRPQLAKEAKVAEHAVPQVVEQYITYSVPAALPGALGIPKIHRDITNLWKWRSKAEKRLGRLERITAAGVFAGLLANALGIATRCIRRGNVGKAARRVCGMDSSLLDSLLLDGLAIAGAVSVVEFAKGLQEIEDEAVAVLGGLIREWPS